MSKGLGDIIALLIKHIGKEIEYLTVICKEREFTFNPQLSKVELKENSLLIVYDGLIVHFNYSEIVDIVELVAL